MDRKIDHWKDVNIMEKMIKELKFYIKKIQVFQKQEILELNILMETISHLLI